MIDGAMNADRLLAHYERIADAPDAIPRLRRFILDLAVRGKLVPQDPKDEPASELLKRIAKEKARLVKEGKAIQDALPAIDLGQSPFELPPGWAWGRFPEVGTFGRGKSKHRPRNDPALFEGGEHLMIQTGDVARSQGVIKTYTSKYNDFGLAQSFKWPKGTLCITIAANIADSGILSFDACFPDSVVGFIPALMFDNARYFEYFMRTAKANLLEYAPATAQKNINLEILTQVLIPLPPLAEQHRIVARVDKLMALCDRLEAARADREKTRDRLSAASLARLNAPDPDPATFAGHARFTLDNLGALTTRPDQIKQLRQTILNLAVRGKLVPQDPHDEPASELLRRAVTAQREAAEEEGLRSRPSIERVGRDDLWFDFPDSWGLASFDDVFVIVSGVTKGQKIAQSEAIEVPYLRVANVQRGHLDLAVIKKIAIRASDKVRYRLRSGDILMTEGGDWDKLGRAAIWREEIDDCIHQNHVFRVRSASKDILPEWVVTYANSLLGRAFFEDASKQTTNLASINMTQLRACPLPLPPLVEQHRIVAKVDALMALCDRLEASLTSGAATRRRLLDALLAEALEPAVQRRAEAAE